MLAGDWWCYFKHWSLSFDGEAQVWLSPFFYCVFMCIPSVGLLWPDAYAHTICLFCLQNRHNWEMNKKTLMTMLFTPCDHSHPLRSVEADIFLVHDTTSSKLVVCGVVWSVCCCGCLLILFITIALLRLLFCGTPDASKKLKVPLVRSHVYTLMQTQTHKHTNTRIQ